MHVIAATDAGKEGAAVDAGIVQAVFQGRNRTMSSISLTHDRDDLALCALVGFGSANDYLDAVPLAKA